MPYSDKLAIRIRERLGDLPNIEEKEMIDGLTFMYNHKMFVGIIKDELMCYIDPTFATVVGTPKLQGRCPHRPARMLGL